METKETLLTYFKSNHRGDNPLHRNLMSKEEIRFAEQLVKDGLLIKGTAIEDKRIKIYYYDIND
jgi:hypothetical protein